MEKKAYTKAMKQFMDLSDTTDFSEACRVLDLLHRVYVATIRKNPESA